jgi:glycosyltransferase involved in cell wall biosynthesis
LGNKKILYRDFAPWITNQIHEFEKFNDVELHVISPHAGLTRFSYEFERQGVHYHFFKPELPFLLDKIGNRLFKIKNRKFRLNRFFVKRFLKKINPDIVNLIGTENPYYSITTLDIKDVPVFVSAQTVYTNPARKKLSGQCDPFRWDLELKIHKKERYFGCGGRMHRDLIVDNNPNAIVFKNFFPIQKPGQVRDVPQKYDFVFFAAGVTPKKGIEDAIDALALIKKDKPDVTLNVVGSCSVDYKTKLTAKIENLGLTDNVTFNGYFPIHSDMHQHIKSAGVAVLPIKLDVIPGTVIEAMLLEIPVIAYKTTGTPYLNKDGETVLLADIGDIKTLADHMEVLLNSSDLADNLRRKAKVFVEKELDNTLSARRLVKNYHAVIDHYKNNQPIPEDRLFNLKEFPLY